MNYIHMNPYCANSFLFVSVHSLAVPAAPSSDDDDTEAGPNKVPDPAWSSNLDSAVTHKGVMVCDCNHNMGEQAWPLKSVPGVQHRY